jgi:hypothetical protein
MISCSALPLHGSGYAPGQLHMILIESTAAFRSMPLTPDLLHDVDYRAGAIPHADALELYRTRCDLGVRGIEQHLVGLARHQNIRNGGIWNSDNRQSSAGQHRRIWAYVSVLLVVRQ